MKFNERLRELRDEKGMSQKELAETIKSTQRTISNWELGTSEPPFRTLVFLAEFFDVSTDYLLGITDAPTPYPKSIL